MSKLIPCKHPFSNGSEYMWFLENQCGLCTRYRNGRCRVYNRIEDARWDESMFPYDDLLDYEQYAGKACKRFTTEPQKHANHRREIDGQIVMEV